MPALVTNLSLVTALWALLSCSGNSPSPEPTPTPVVKGFTAHWNVAPEAQGGYSVHLNSPDGYQHIAVSREVLSARIEASTAGEYVVCVSAINASGEAGPCSQSAVYVHQP